MPHDNTPHFSRQSQKILDLLRAANGRWVPLPDILSLGIAQYNARIFELRKAGHVIENRLEKIDGVPHSAFRLVEERDWYVQTTGQRRPKPKPTSKSAKLADDLPLFDSLEQSA